MIANTNPETGIRYGVIAINNLDPDVVDELWYGTGATDLSYKAALEELDALVAREADALIESGSLERDDWDWYVDRETDKRRDFILIDEPTIEGTYQGVTYQISWLGGAPLLFVFESPVISRASPCSPCVQNGGDLDNLDDDGVECYGVPRDWRRDETAGQFTVPDFLGGQP